MTSSVVWAVDGRQAVGWARRLATSPLVAFDLETTGLRPHGLPGDEVKPAVVMLTMSGYLEDHGTVDVIVPLWHPDSGVRMCWQDVLWRVMEPFVISSTPLAAQNGIFDMAWILVHTGLEVPLAFDTEIAGRLEDENRSNRLEDLAVSLLGAPEWKTTMDFKKRRADQTDLWELGVYAANDTHWTLRLAEHLRQTMTPDHYRLMQSMCRALPALVEMQHTGLLLDEAQASEELVQLDAKHERLLAQLASMWPQIEGKPSAQAGKWLNDVMAASVAAGESVVIERTKKGVPSWTASTLGRQDGRTAGLILEARDAAKQAQFIRSWYATTAPDGRIHPSYRVTSTVTGRLSSASPNCQQIARSQKHLFVPPPGHLLLDVDYSQLELRIIAHMAESAPMQRAFCAGDDLHRLLAARLTGKRPEDVTKDERQLGKTINFELAFGGSAEKLQAIMRDHAGIDMPMNQAKLAYWTYLDTWDLDRWRRTVRDWVEAEGSIDSPVGRTRHLPDIWSRNRTKQSEAFRQALNAPVQGFGCDMGLIGLYLLHKHMPPDFRLVSTVHDSFQAIAPAESAERYLGMMMDLLTTGVYTALANEFDVWLKVPLAVEGSVEERWGMAVDGTTKEVSYLPEEMMI